jgi:ABC-type nitrate/sulfonate/bicarbonate transport system substrate-binding protein
MRRRDLLTGLTLAALGCTRRRPASGLRKIRVTAVRRLSTSSLHLANELGYFRDAGFDLEILQGGNSLASLALLAGGKIEAVFGSTGTAFLNAVIRGLPLRIVLGREIASPTCGTVGAVYGLRRTFPRGLSDLSQLKGKRVATGPSVGLARFALDTYLERAGLSARDVSLVSIEFKQSVAALMGGGVDAVVGADDLDRDLATLSGEIVRSAGLAQIYPSFQFSYILFGETMRAMALDRGANFLGAYLRGAREFAHGKTPQFMERFARANGLDFERARTACRETFSLDGAIDRNSLRLFSEWAARKGHIPRAVSLDELVDDRFLRRLHAA